MRIAYLNRADAATLTAVPAAQSDKPVTYLQNDDRGYVFRSADVSSPQVIYGEWSGTSYAISCCRLDRSNLQTNDTWRLQLYSDAAWATQVYDSGTVDVFTDNTFDAWDFAFSELFFTEQVGVKSFKFTITSSSNPDGYIEVARLFLGPYTEATYDPKVGLSSGWVDNSKQTRRRGGTIEVDEQAQWRTMSFDMFLATEADRATWAEIGRYCGKRKTVWVSVFPGLGTAQERDYSLLGKFQESPLKKIIGLNQYDFSLTLNEV